MGGDGGAFDQVRDFVEAGGYGRAVATVRALCGPGVDAEDAVQDALARALTRSGIRSLGPWVAVTAVNGVRQSLRREARQATATTSRPDVADVPDVELRHVVLQAIRELSRRQQEVVLLRYFWDLPVGEIADVLGIAAGTVKLQLFRARGHLRTALTTKVEVDV